VVAAAFGAEPVHWRAPHTGLSAAERFVVRLANGSSAFVKAAVDETTARWLRTEHEILASVAADFVPRPLVWIDDAERPVLVIEDLSEAYWPADHGSVIWRPGHFALLFDTLRRVAATTPPASLPTAESGFEPQWPAIAGEAEQFLALGLCSESWFRDALGGLVQAERTVPLAGSTLVHNDVRSDNLCIVGARVVLVDWGNALRGHPEHDLATVLSTMPLEGGPDPFDVLPGGGAWAAYHAARAARRAYLPDPGTPPWLRSVLRRITAVCLAWSARALDLPPWTGPHWTATR
jgi:aminoglycoside phosphotransferase (APT) family kinase protein